MTAVLVLWIICGLAVWLHTISEKGVNLFIDILGLPIVLLFGPVLLLKHFLDRT